MGRSWAPFGKGLGRCWASWECSWELLGRSWGALEMLLALLEAKISSKKPFGWILGRFGKVGGRFGEALRGNFKGFGAECWERLGRVRDNWGQLGKKLGKASAS